MARKVKYYSLREVKRRGKIDGRDWRWKPWRPFPGWPLWERKEPTPALDQQEPSEYEKQLLEDAEQNISRLLQEWHQKDKELHKRCANAEDNYKNIKESVNKENQEHIDAIKNYEKAREEYNSLPKPHWTGWQYWIPLILITSGEMLFNGLVFLIFGQSRFHTYIMALGLIVAIPVVTHFIGRSLRMEKKTPIREKMVIGAGVIFIAGLVILAVLRETFFEVNKIAETLGLQWSPNKFVLSFFIINLLFFTALLILAYESGPLDPEEHARLKDVLKEAKERLKNEAGDAQEAINAFIKAKEEFNKAHFERIHEFEIIKAKAEEERDIWISYIQAYRAANMKARRDGRKPKSFNRDLEELIKIPKELQTLDCGRCCYEKERGEE